MLEQIKPTTLAEVDAIFREDKGGCRAFIQSMIDSGRATIDEVVAFQSQR